ncbi:TPA: hypothetical protein ACXP4I_001056 [Klebsiella variicola]|uniref:hypothetical protein n=1 Tax=Klebsiella variicola TaxID=244366 RepID=UPI000945AEC6|nr:hypothetical protein [Klebsiella variicola]
MHAKTEGEIIYLKSDDYKKERNLSAAFATCLVTHMLQMQLIYNLPENKFILTFIWITAGLITDAVVSDRHEISNYDGSFINPAVVSSAEAS